MKLAVHPTYDQMVSDIEEAARTGNMPLLERFVLAYRKSAYAPYLMADTRIERLIPELRAAYSAYETEDEIRLCKSLMEEPAPRIVGSVPIVRTFRYAPFEAQAAGITNDSRYCHIGSGPLPETGVAMRIFAPAAGVTCVDADYGMLCRGRELASALWPGVGSGIGFLHAFGHELDYQGFTHVHISVLVRSELPTVKAICETADPDVTVMLRTVDGMGGLLYEPVSDETQTLLIANGFRRVDTVRGRTIMNTLIYRK